MQEISANYDLIRQLYSMKNTLYCGDNLDVLRKHIKAAGLKHDESMDIKLIEVEILLLKKKPIE